jgi:hypothetical protein
MGEENRDTDTSGTVRLTKSPTSRERCQTQQQVRLRPTSHDEAQPHEAHTEIPPDDNAPAGAGARRAALRSAVYCIRRLRRPCSRINGGNSSASSKPIPHPIPVLMASQPSKGIPSSVSPVTHASVLPRAMPVSCVQ